MTKKILDKIKFSNPGIYHIQVLGNVSDEIWDNFEGETEQVKEDDKGQVTTLLKIYVRDQAELSGLIHMLYDWQLVLLSVKMEGHIENKAL